MSPVILAAGIALSAPAAVQRSFRNEAEGENRSLRWAFDDESGKRRDVAVALPAAAIEHDNQLPKVFPAENAAKAQARAVRAYADGLRGVKIEARTSKSGTLSLSASGEAGRVGPALDAAQAVADAELASWMEKHRFTTLRGGGVVHDHARIAADYADDVAPLAAALGVDDPSARAFVERALVFVQSIPYEKRRTGADAGFRRPLSVLARNKGDCDSKGTLFLALVRARHPELAGAVVYIPNHAFVGLALEPEPGERSFTRGGVVYVGLEPVGPAQAALGEVSGPSGWHLFWGSAEARALPAPS